MRKKVFVSFLKPPVGSSFYIEGLRIALGILGGKEEHLVTVAFIGRGVRNALKGIDRSYATSMIDLFQRDADGKRFYVEKESLDEEKILGTELDENFGVASREELRKKMLEADISISF